jgi:hypothetical protein
MRLRETGLGHGEAGLLQLKFNRVANVVAEAYDCYRPVVNTHGTAKVFVMAWNQMPRELSRWRDREPDGKDGDSVEEMNVEWPIDTFGSSDGLPRRRLLLDLLHSSLLELATARGWDREPFQTAYMDTIQSQIEARWESVPKTSPDRRLSVVTTGRVAESGAWFHVVVRDRAGEVVLATDEEPVEMAELNEVKIRCNKVKWSGNQRVVVESRPLRGLIDPAYPPIYIDVPSS